MARRLKYKKYVNSWTLSHPLVVVVLHSLPERLYPIGKIFMAICSMCNRVYGLFLATIRQSMCCTNIIIKKWRWWKEKFATLRVLLKRKSKSFSFLHQHYDCAQKLFSSRSYVRKSFTHCFNAVDHSIFQYTHSFLDVPEEWKRIGNRKKSVRRKSLNAAHIVSRKSQWECRH